MAAIYSGIHVKLKSSRTPWADKLKLARFAWISPQCVLPNKEQVLFDWTSHALTCYYGKKAELPLSVVEGLWAYLDDILHSKKLQKALSQGKALSLRLALAQVISERVLECVSGSCPVSQSTVLSICQGILSSPALATTYTTKYELLVELVSRLCALACSKLGPQSAWEPLTAQVFEVLLQAVGSYLAVQRQQANPNRVFSQVAAHLLQPLLLLRHLLATRAWLPEDDGHVRHHLSREVRNKVDAVLQSALFTADHLPSYKEELLPEKEVSSTKKGPTAKGLLSPASTILKKLCESGFCDPSLQFAVRSNSLPLLFKFALDAFSKGGDDNTVCFLLLTRFIAALDITEALTLKDTFDSGNWSLALLTLENLLNLSLTADIYNVAADRIHHGEAQFNFYRKVAQLLLSNAQTAIPAWYRCLKTLLAMNHMIIEPDLDDLVCCSWIDSDCEDLRVNKAREVLISSVFQTYEKLRQLPRLLQEAVEVICRPAIDKFRPPVLTAALQKSLGQCILNSPHSQSLEMCTLILGRMQRFLLPHLQEDEDMALKLFSLTVLLHSILFSVKSLDDGTPVPILKRAQNIMEEMLKVIRSLLGHLDAHTPGSLWFDKALEATLLLSYTWVEVDTLFKIHCSKYVSLGTEDSGSPRLTERRICLLPCVAVKEWEKVALKSKECSSANQLLRELLALQRMKQILLRTDVLLDENVQEVLGKVARFIVRTGASSLTQPFGALWDGQIGTVDDSNYPVAHWFHVTSNLPLVAPYLSQEDLSCLAGFLLNSLLQGEIRDASNQENCLSVTLISKHLLDSSLLVELAPLYSLVVKSFLQRIVGILRSSAGHRCCKALATFEEAVSAEAEEEMEASVEESSEASPSLRRLLSVSRETLSLVRTGAAISLSRTQTEHLLHLLKVSRTLKPDGMSSEDHSAYVLLLFFIASTFQRDSSTEPAEAVRLLKEVYSLMTFLQTGKNVGSVLKVLHGNELLEAAITSLFSHCSMSVLETVDSTAWLAFLQVVQDFLRCLIQTIINRKKSVRLNLEKFTTFMVENEQVAAALSASCSKLGVEKLKPLQLALAAFCTLSRVMTSSLGESEKMDETLAPLLEKCVISMGPAVQSSLKGEACRLLGQSFTVEIVTGMLEAELAWTSCLASSGEGAPTKSRLCHMSLYKTFSQQILRELSSSSRPMDFISSSLHFLSAYHSALESIQDPGQKDLFHLVVQNLRKLLSAPWLSVSDMQKLEPTVGQLLAQLVTRSPLEQFQHLLAAVGEDLGAQVSGGRHTEVLSAVTLSKLLASCPLPETHSKAFWLVAPQITSAIVSAVKECGKDRSLTESLTVPALQALAALLRWGEGVLQNPHHVTLAFGALPFVQLEHPSPAGYHSVFEAVHETLFAVVQCHPQVTLSAAPSFLNCFYRLVVSIMHEGRQRGDTEKGSEEETDALLKCARLVERMYSHIASVAEGFTVLSSFVVAQYVCELQKVTLQPEIKSHLTEGVYRILDLCSEQDIRFLNTALQPGVREVFGELYDGYTHYHKTQRQGEEKYTV
ncbi:unhealthy ribosome biogenesis protein 2 homolog isoform X1 [Scleropages formosus]|nr:unhealthy ribosome biogenesis protein 2 homolog isoform X1 [Scleropages formosus]XP_018605058.2 unhealthy ribosome biogenesis protein 2 homolog isoform X1 [Scleropages formosus]